MKSHTSALALGASWIGCLCISTNVYAKPLKPAAHESPERVATADQAVFVSCKVGKNFQPNNSVDNVVSDDVRTFKLITGQPAVAQPIMEWSDTGEQLTSVCTGKCSYVVTASDAAWYTVDERYPAEGEINRVTGDFHEEATNALGTDVEKGQCSKTSDPTVGVKPKF